MLQAQVIELTPIHLIQCHALLHIIQTRQSELTEQNRRLRFQNSLKHASAATPCKRVTAAASLALKSESKLCTQISLEGGPSPIAQPAVYATTAGAIMVGPIAPRPTRTIQWLLQASRKGHQLPNWCRLNHAIFQPYFNPYFNRDTI